MSQAEYYRGIEAAQQALARVPGHAAPARAAAVHAALAPLFDNTLAARHRACRRGCSHCCHLPVAVTFGEAARLVHTLMQQPDLRAHVLGDAERTEATPWSGLVGQPCPLLADGACSVHEARPLPCRALASSDADACARGLRGEGNVPVDDDAFWRGLGATEALSLADCPEGTRELRSALHALLTAQGDDAPAAFRAAKSAGIEGTEGTG